MKCIRHLFLFFYISSINSLSLAQSTERVDDGSTDKLSTNTLSPVQSLDQLHSQQSFRISDSDPGLKSLRGHVVSKEQQYGTLNTPGKVEAVTGDRRLLSEGLQSLLTTPLKDWTLQQWLVLLVIFWVTYNFCCCGCMQDIIACFCCYSLFCNDGYEWF